VYLTSTTSYPTRRDAMFKQLVEAVVFAVRAVGVCMMVLAVGAVAVVLVVESINLGVGLLSLLAHGV
jgi:hypothetical protein